VRRVHPDAMVTSASDPPLRLLLVSGNRATSDALSSHLGRRGFPIISRATSAEGATHAARSAPFDVALVDASVPEGWRAVVGALDGVVPASSIVVLAPYWPAEERRDAARRGIGATLLAGADRHTLATHLLALGAGSRGRRAGSH
jgi:DNA-binding NarL/FixJ family response regulator